LKATSLRLMVECVDGRESSFVYDVGADELELLMIEHDDVQVVYWGRYDEGGWAHASDEHERIRRTLEEKK
jgi:hypothetical protein